MENDANSKASEVASGKALMNRSLLLVFDLREHQPRRPCADHDYRGEGINRAIGTISFVICAK